MTLLYYDPCFLDHETGSHPERALRLSTAVDRLAKLGLDRRCKRNDWKPASIERLSRVHSPEYVRELRAFVERGGGRIEADTVVSPKSFDVALRAAGAVCDAVDRIVRGDETRALCLVRPPGHHALQAGAMGFCLLNNVAVGARVAIDDLKLDRVLIVDWDVHHGNGTQDTFWHDEQVGFFSIHRWPFYPGTGDSGETGAGKGLGYTLNLPTRFGTTRKDYLARFTVELERFAAKVKPQLIMISAGFDAHRMDPIGSLELESEDFGELTSVVVQLASEHCGGKLVSVLEGGYHPEKLAESVAIHLEKLLSDDKPER